jgi:hypothetical protein
MIISSQVISDLMASIGSIFDACKPLILLIVGVGIVFYIAKNIQELLPHK